MPDLCSFGYFAITPLLTPCSALFCHLVSTCTDLSSLPHSTDVQVICYWLTGWLITRLNRLTLEPLCCLVPVYAMLPLLAFCPQLRLSCPVFPAVYIHITNLGVYWCLCEECSPLRTSLGGGGTRCFNWKKAPPPFLVHSSDDRRTDNSVASVPF
jgi:hypothetical protein